MVFWAGLCCRGETIKASSVEWRANEVQLDKNCQEKICLGQGNYREYPTRWDLAKVGVCMCPCFCLTLMQVCQRYGRHGKNSCLALYQLNSPARLTPKRNLFIILSKKSVYRSETLPKLWGAVLVPVSGAKCLPKGFVVGQIPWCSFISRTKSLLWPTYVHP